MAPSLVQPNARAHLLPEAGARYERTLEAVGCRPMFGAVMLDLRMRTPLEGSLQLGQIILARLFSRPTSGEMVDRQASGEQVSTLDSAANIEEESPWVDDEHQVTI